jgi:hypothetical protein
VNIQEEEEEEEEEKEEADVKELRKGSGRWDSTIVSSQKAGSP